MTEPVHMLHPSLWENLAKAQRRDVCRRSMAQFDEVAGAYLLDFLQERYRISPGSRECKLVAGSVLTEEPSVDLRVTLLTYLLNAKEIPLARKLVAGSNLKGGKTFFEGTHGFPIEALAQRYGRDPEAFLAKGFSMGAVQESFGDASLQFPALPRIPVTMVLWRADEEFSARLNVLFDASIDQHLPLDAIYGLVSEICRRMGRD